MRVATQSYPGSPQWPPPTPRPGARPDREVNALVRRFNGTYSRSAQCWEVRAERQAELVDALRTLFHLRGLSRKYREGWGGAGAVTGEAHAHEADVFFLGEPEFLDAAERQDVLAVIETFGGRQWVHEGRCKGVNVPHGTDLATLRDAFANARRAAERRRDGGGAGVPFAVQRLQIVLATLGVSLGASDLQDVLAEAFGPCAVAVPAPWRSHRDVPRVPKLPVGPARPPWRSASRRREFS